MTLPQFLEYMESDEPRKVSHSDGMAALLEQAREKELTTRDNRLLYESWRSLLHD